MGRRRRRRVVQGNANRGVVGVRTAEEMEGERRATRVEQRALGQPGIRVQRGLSDAEKRAAEMVRRVQGDPPPW
jgi:hypothetical protein